MRKWLAISLVPAILLAAPGAQAEIYKCVAEDGALSYSQVPCPKQKSEAVQTVASRADEPVDCRWATRFAGDVARRMRAGQGSDSTLNLYGGVDSVSKGTLNIINYVYRFRSDENTPITRISSLAGSMCQAGSLGDVRCESLPYGDDPTGERCNPDADDGAGVRPPVSAFAAGSGPASAGPTQSNRASTATDERSSAAREACRDNYRDQIDRIDAEMRSGYDSAQGERYRERLRALTTRMREC